MDMVLPPSRTASARDLYDDDGMIVIVMSEELMMDLRSGRWLKDTEVSVPS